MAEDGDFGKEAVVVYGWSPGIGDPDVLGWVTTIAYLAAAALAGWAAVAVRPGGEIAGDPGRRRRQYWAGLGVVLLLLGINKQLDLQELVTIIGRHVAEEDGWYAERRGVQEVFILSLMAVGALLAWLLARSTRFDGLAERMAAIGCVLLIVFIVIRAASFHHVDLLLNRRAAGVRINHILELGGICLVALPAGAAIIWGSRDRLRRARR